MIGTFVTIHSFYVTIFAIFVIFDGILLYMWEGYEGCKLFALNLGNSKHATILKKSKVILRSASFRLFKYLLYNLELYLVVN